MKMFRILCVLCAGLLAGAEVLAASKWQRYQSNTPLTLGNYDVTYTLGGAKAARYWIKFEGRRVALATIETAAGETKRVSFTARVKGPIANGAGPFKEAPYPDCLNLTVITEGAEPPKPTIVANDGAPTIYLCGDSTVTDQQAEPWGSWGQCAPLCFEKGVAVANFARSGLTTETFWNQGRLAKICAHAKKGDVVLVQFGHNDQKRDNLRPDPDGGYERYLNCYVDEIRQTGADVVFVTPVERLRYDAQTQLQEPHTLADYAEAMKRVAAAREVPVIDLNAASYRVYGALGFAGAPKLFAKTDRTHHNIYGAMVMSRFVMNELVKIRTDLAPFLREKYRGFDPDKPPVEEYVPASGELDLSRPEGDGGRDLQAEIDALAAKGGGTLHLAAGTYRTGALFFRPGVNLHLEKGATIVGVDEASGYPKRETRIEGETCSYYPALINADGCNGFTISGEGVIDGHGANTWEEFWTRRAAARQTGEDFRNKTLMRPRLLYISNSTNVNISGVTFKNSKFWTTHYYRCADVTVHDCAILADVLVDSQGKELKGPSTDAIDIDVCDRFTVRNVTIAVNDDGVVVKGGKGPYANDYAKFPGNGPSHDVLVEDCVFKAPTHSCLTLGSECPEASQITLRNCRVENAGNLLTLKMRTDTPQHYADVLVENVTGSVGTYFNVPVWRQYEDLKGRAKQDVKSFAERITMRNCAVTCQVEQKVKPDDEIFELRESAVEAPVAHPAFVAAKSILAKGAPGVEVRFELGATPEVKNDGYVVRRDGASYVIRAAVPRAFLFAAGEPQRWLGVEGNRSVVRDPAFKVRLLNIGNRSGNAHSLAEWIAATGCNTVHYNRKVPGRLASEAKALGLDAYAFLYGCDPLKWDRAACEAYMAEHPSCRGTDPGGSWEKGVMCPSDPATWDYFRKTITDLATSGEYDGVVVTLWDDYGLRCRCGTCRHNGMHLFSRQIAGAVRAFESALEPLGKKLIVRTWASGAPHFLGDEWVHAPGYASAADAIDTWGHAFAKTCPTTAYQTKVYNADCQPNPPFSHLLGKATPRHPEIAEWQITGQTVGRQYLAAPVVAHTAWTMKRAHALTQGYGACLYAGGYKHSGYEALDDDVNSISIYAWRQLSWNPDEDLETLWAEWATPRYGAAAPQAIAALKVAEEAAVASFSPLGLGAPTESGFANSVTRREDLLRYTNRQYLPEGRAALEPTRENIARVVGEKDAALARVEEALAPLAESDLKTRLLALRGHLRVSRALDGALWRLKYLRHLRELGTSDSAVLAEIEADFEAVRLHAAEVPRELGSPIPLMRDITAQAAECAARMIGHERGGKGPAADAATAWK